MVLSSALSVDCCRLAFRASVARSIEIISYTPAHFFTLPAKDFVFIAKLQAWVNPKKKI